MCCSSFLGPFKKKWGVEAQKWEYGFFRNRNFWLPKFVWILFFVCKIWRKILPKISEVCGMKSKALFCKTNFCWKFRFLKVG